MIYMSHRTLRTQVCHRTTAGLKEFPCLSPSLPQSHKQGGPRSPPGTIARDLREHSPTSKKALDHNPPKYIIVSDSNFDVQILNAIFNKRGVWISYVLMQKCGFANVYISRNDVNVVELLVDASDAQCVRMEMLALLDMPFGYNSFMVHGRNTVLREVHAQLPYARGPFLTH